MQTLNITRAIARELASLIGELDLTELHPDVVLAIKDLEESLDIVQNQTPDSIHIHVTGLRKDLDDAAA